LYLYMQQAALETRVQRREGSKEITRRWAAPQSQGQETGNEELHGKDENESPERHRVECWPGRHMNQSGASLKYAGEIHQERSQDFIAYWPPNTPKGHTPRRLC
jgi:hypothetical protein